MADKYQAREMERRWQAEWEAAGLYRTEDDPGRPKYYALVMFPYTSGDLHIGHWYNFAPADVHARYKRMRGYNVLFPIGFDAFGLPAEEAAIRNNIHPFTWTINNIRRMEGQLKTIGAMYDWSREIATCLPEYYRWNQWFFLKLLERGLAYRAKAPANWCPHCQTVLANEQVEDGRCERCETVVTRRDLEQWFFKITDYAEELLDDLDTIEWPDRVKAMQRNWIGKSHGVEFRLQVAGREGLEIPVYTTRVDTVFGMTYVVLAPEHPLVDELVSGDKIDEVRAYQEQARRASEIDRLSTDREKTGVFLGAEAVNPANGELVPIWIADYVLASYGTGAIMAVPAHDQRDFEFAQKFGLPIRQVIRPPDDRARPHPDPLPLGEGTTPAPSPPPSPPMGAREFAAFPSPLAGEGEGGGASTTVPQAYTEPGIMVNSAQFDGIPSEEAKDRIADWFQERGIGGRKVNYRIRDWLISRQRYWGTPIPVVYCERDGIVPLPEDQLPVLLPEDAEFLPTGQSPLLLHEGFLHTTCPTCGGPARRETDTMDTFVDSSWYMLRYCDPSIDTAPFDREAVERWMPVDQYMGGVEHAVMHLLYARFFIKALRSIGMISFGEPFMRLYNQGIILGPDGLKMSKTRGNVVNPDDYVERLGADTVRCYLMFIGPWDSGGPWNPQGISGVDNFLHRLWDLTLDGAGENAPARQGPEDEQVLRLIHKTIKRVTDDLERFSFNTMLAALMEATNTLRRLRGKVSRAMWQQATEQLVLLVAPSAPHLAEELWHRMGHTDSVHLQSWPAYDPALTVDPMVTLIVQVNGKVRDKLEVPAGVAEDEARRLATESPRVQAHLNGAKVRQVVYVPGRLVNIVAN